MSNPGPNEQQLRTILDAPPWSAPGMRSLRSALSSLERTLADLSQPDPQAWSGAAAESAAAAFGDLAESYSDLEDALHRVNEAVDAANRARERARSNFDGLPSATVPGYVRTAVNIAKAAGEHNVIIGGYAYVADQAVGIFERFMGNRREEEARAVLDRLADELEPHHGSLAHDRSTFFPSSGPGIDSSGANDPDAGSWPPAPPPSGGVPPRGTVPGITALPPGGTPMPGVPDTPTQPSPTIPVTPGPGGVGTTPQTPTTPGSGTGGDSGSWPNRPPATGGNDNTIPGTWPGYTPISADDGSTGSFGGGGFSSGALGGGAAAAAAALRFGSGAGIGGSAVPGTAVPGTGGLLGAGAPGVAGGGTGVAGTGGLTGGVIHTGGAGAGGSSGAAGAGSRGGMLAGGAPGSAADEEKKKKTAGLGGPIAPTLEDDEDFVPLPDAARAGGRASSDEPDT